MEVTVPLRHEVLRLSYPFDPENELLKPIVSRCSLLAVAVRETTRNSGTHRVVVVPDIPLDSNHADRSNVDVPAVEVVPLGKAMHHPGVDSVAVHELNLGEPDALLEAGRGPDAGHHHQLDELLGLEGEFPALRLLQSIFGRRDALLGKRF